ncbi:MAG: hypothetical protein H6734_02210 [Alphaproteobacteria bacterium]|nr:hypothetical protein [Alphaproteobacteria bacterium]
MTLLLTLACGSPAPAGAHDTALAAIRADAPPCTDERTDVRVWRKPDLSVHRYFVEGSPEVCSHPTATWYDADGKRLDYVAFEPLTSENAAYYEDLHARHATGATAMESVPLFPSH